MPILLIGYGVIGLSLAGWMEWHEGRSNMGAILAVSGMVSFSSGADTLWRRTNSRITWPKFVTNGLNLCIFLLCATGTVVLTHSLWIGWSTGVLRIVQRHSGPMTLVLADNPQQFWFWFAFMATVLTTGLMIFLMVAVILITRKFRHHGHGQP